MNGVDPPENQRETFQVIATVEVAHPGNATARRDGEQQHGHGWSWRNPAAWAAGVAIIAACFTGGTLCVNHRSMVATQRAWLTVDAIRDFELVADQPLRIEIEVGNSGKSPAYNLRPETDIRATSTQPPLPPVYSEASTGRAVVGPGKSRPVYLDLPQGLPKTNYDAVIAGTQTLYFWIRFTYDHPFGEGGAEICAEYIAKTRKVTFCGGDYNRVW